MNSKLSQGYSLVELLIVVMVIGMLSVIGVVVYSNFNQTARDGRRKADLENVRSALEQYKSTNSSYPSSLTSLSEDGFLNSIPTDPVTRVAYSYASLPSGCDETAGNICTGYQISACFEGAGCPPAAARLIGPYDTL